MSPWLVLAAAFLVLLAIAGGAGLALAAYRLASDHDPATRGEGEMLDLLRAERARMRADFAEGISQLEPIAETTKRHRKRVEAVEQRALELDKAPEPEVEAEPEVLRNRLRSQLRAAGKL